MYIKTILPIALLMTLLFMSCKEDAKSEKEAVENLMNLEGSIENFKDGTAKLMEINAMNLEEKNNFFAEAQVKGGKFYFANIQIDTVRAVNLRFGDSLNTIFFLEPGTLQLKVLLKDTIFSELHAGTQIRSVASGTKNNEAFSEYKRMRHALEAKQKYGAIRSYDKHLFADIPDFDLINETLSANADLLSERDSLVFALKEKTIRNHQDKMVAPYMLVNEDFGIGEDFEGAKVVELFAELDDELKGNLYYDQVAEFVSASKNTVVGAIAPDFVLKNQKGENITLSDLDQDYTLIDFWAYWCVPCIASFPHLEEVREKYKDQSFEILGVSADPNQEKWMEALNKYHPSWIQVIDSDDKTVSSAYNITELPTSFLLDKNGKIIAKNPEGDALDHLLEELFDK